MIKAIETVYKGYRFRSRLEARWAVFFDALGVKWEYEKEGFDLGELGWYLPDFFIPELETWIEIKPAGPAGPTEYGEGFDKVCALYEITAQNAVLLSGIPGPFTDGPYDDDRPYVGTAVGDCPYVWCECPDCGSIGIQFDGRSARNKHMAGCKAMTGDKGYNYNSPRILAACQAARAARFEHGERG